MSERRLENVTIENVRIAFRNFAGKEGQYNREGDRNFAVILPQNVAEDMDADGWNIKYLKPREEGDQPQAYVQVTVGFKGRPPRIVMLTGRGRTNLTEAEVDVLDWAEIETSDVIIRPYEWEVNGKRGVKAYLQSLYVTIREDDLDRKYANVPDTGQGPAYDED